MTDGDGQAKMRPSLIKKKHAGGRPSKYGSISLEQVETAGRLGGTNEEIAILLGINVSTLLRYKKIPEFCTILKKGKVEADNRVVLSLYQRAMGYNFTEETQELMNIPDPNHPGQRLSLQQMVVTKRVTKHIPPDVAATFIWLKNRRPEEWRDVHEFKAQEPKKYEDPFLELARLLGEAGIPVEEAIDRRPSRPSNSEPQ